MFANEDEVGEYKLLSNEDWKHTFENLPKFKEGKEIKYSIKEDKVEKNNQEELILLDADDAHEF